MSRIAIIDTMIATQHIGNKAIEFYDLCDNIGVTDSNKINHGTLCAMILEYCASDYDLVNIRVFERDGKKVFGETDILAKALELCYELKVDVISLSAVSSILTDSRYLFGITRRLTANTLIVSALDNKGYVTVPTSYPHVIGVRNDSAGVLLPGELAYCASDPFGANVYTNCNFEYTRDICRKPSNSLAVPIVAAYVNTLLNQGNRNRESTIFCKSLGVIQRR